MFLNLTLKNTHQKFRFQTGAISHPQGEPMLKAINIQKATPLNEENEPQEEKLTEEHIATLTHCSTAHEEGINTSIDEDQL